MSATVEPTFSILLQRFFTQRLMQQKKVSPHTLCSYRDTFRLMLRFAQKKLHTTPERLSIEQIDTPFVTAFLNDLEDSRVRECTNAEPAAHRYPFVLSICIL
jgi:site-specific recombinase XerC